MVANLQRYGINFSYYSTMNYPLISVLVATFNSERTLQRTLSSVKSQTYPQNKIEILVVDGGSTDNTKNIAKSYNCKILPNEKVDPVSAKYIGFKKASGKYILCLDSDEVLSTPNSLRIKYQAFTKNDQVRAVIPSGYKTPQEGSSINYYINEFGDPFSYFFYQESKSGNNLLKSWSSKYQKILEYKDAAIFKFSDKVNLPLLELSAGGCMVDLEYTKKTFPQIKTDPSIIPHIFYLLNSKGALVAITKNDSTVHYSSDTLVRYLKKISSRVKNNVFTTSIGWVGFKGREQFQPLMLNIKKYLFIPYSLSLILPSIDSIQLALSRKRLVYLLHLPLCIYTSLMIIYFYTIKVLGAKPNIRIYGA